MLTVSAAVDANLSWNMEITFQIDMKERLTY